jgi:hypothetical protein
MARNRSAKTRRESKRKQKQYVLEHQRQLAEEERKQYLLTVDPENSNRLVVRSLERRPPAFGLRAAFGSMMRRVFAYAPTPMHAEDVQYFRFEAEEITDNYQEMLLRWHQAKLLEKLRAA